MTESKKYAYVVLNRDGSMEAVYTTKNAAIRAVTAGFGYEYGRVVLDVGVQEIQDGLRPFFVKFHQNGNVSVQRRTSLAFFETDRVVTDAQRAEFIVSVWAKNAEQAIERAKNLKEAQSKQEA